MTQDDFSDWLQRTQTKEVLNYLNGRVAQLKSSLATGGTLYDTAEKTLKETSRMVGLIDGIETLLNLTIEDLKEDFLEK